MNRIVWAIAALALSAGAAAQEDGFSYSYIGASYDRADFDGPLGDADGFGVGVSVAIADQFHVFGAYAGLDLDSNVDADGWEAGVGFNTPISDTMDVVVRLAYVSAEARLANGLSVDDDGFGVSAGVRVAASDEIELDLGLGYADTDSGNGTALNAGFLFNVSDAVAVGIGGSWDDDVTVWSATARLYFD